MDRCLNYPPEQSIVEMLDHWLRTCDLEKRNWRNVAKALRQIEHHQLAEEIESIDKTGLLISDHITYLLSIESDKHPPTLGSISC